MKAKATKLLTVLMALLVMASNTYAANTASDQQMRDCLKKQDWKGATSQLKLLIAESPKDAASYVIDNGNEKLWGPKISDAVEVLRTAVQSAPKDAEGLKLRVALLDCYKHLNQWDQAFSLIETIAADYPDKQSTYHNLKAICYYFQGKNPEALTEIKKAADLYNGPQDEKELIDTVLKCYPFDDSNRIIRVVYTMIRYLPGCTEKLRASIYKWAWDICMASACVDEANTIYSRAASCWNKVQADYDDPKILSLLIHAYLDAREYNKAISLCKEILTRKPDMAVDALTVLSECMYALGKEREALTFQIDYYRDHPELKADADWVYAKTVFYTDKDKSKTIPLFEKILTDYPDFKYKIELQSLLAFAYGVTGKTSKQVCVLQEMLNTCPDSEKIDISTQLAVVYSVINIGKAEELLNQLIKDNPNHFLVPKWKVYLADCSFSKGDLTSAYDTYKAIYEQYPDSQYGYKAHLSYAHCCLCRGDKAAAKIALQEIVNKCPDKKTVADATDRLTLLASK